MELITNGEIYNNIPPCKNLNDLYQKYIPWLYALHICALKFEDLVGPKGGGNLEAQYNTIKRIAEHLEISLTEKQLQEKADSLLVEVGHLEKVKSENGKHTLKNITKLHSKKMRVNF